MVKWSLLPYSVRFLTLAMCSSMGFLILVVWLGIECLVLVVWSSMRCLILTVWFRIRCPLLAMCSDIERCIMRNGNDEIFLYALRLLCTTACNSSTKECDKHLSWRRYKDVNNVNDDSGVTIFMWSSFLCDMIWWMTCKDNGFSIWFINTCQRNLNVQIV